MQNSKKVDDLRRPNKTGQLSCQRSTLLWNYMDTHICIELPGGWQESFGFCISLGIWLRMSDAWYHEFIHKCIYSLYRTMHTHELRRLRDFDIKNRLPIFTKPALYFFFINYFIILRRRRELWIPLWSGNLYV